MVITSTTPQAAAETNTTTSSTANTSSTNPNNPNNLASEQTFLQLFVAQLQNQDPLDPNEQDPTQMVSELAQFSELEQLVNIGQNVQSIDQAVAPASTPSSGTQASSQSGDTSNSAAAAGSSQSA